MRAALPICMSVLWLLTLVGGSWADVVFTTEPRTQLRPRPGLRMKPVESVPWGTVFERVKVVETWSRVNMNDSSDVFIWGDFVTTYDVVEARTVSQNQREVHFTVEKYIGRPVWEAMCTHITEGEKEKFPDLKTVSLKGYLASQYPGGEPVCTGRWTRDAGTGGALEVVATEVEPTTSRDEEIHDRLINLFKSEDRKGQAIFAVEEVWTQIGEEYGMSKEEVRFTYDRVRWFRANLLER